MKNTIPVVLGIVVVFLAEDVCGQQFQWPDEPENLQVLPEGTAGNELGAIMRGFVSALDVRCQYCHVGEGNDLTQFDFVSDEKATKQTARLMLKMTRALNQDHLSQLESPSVRVTCVTCHRKNTKPVMLQGVLADAYRNDGIDAAVAKYHELRDKYYGGFTFDFSAGTLTRMGERIGGSGDISAGVRLIELEIEVNGESPAAYFSLGKLQAAGGMSEDATASLTKGMEMAPAGWKPFFQAELDKLTNSTN